MASKETPISLRQRITFTSSSPGSKKISWSTNGELLASPNSNNTIEIWSIDGNLKSTLHGHTNNVYAAVWAPGDQQIASSSSDKSIIIWEASKNWEIGTKLHTQNPSTTLAWSPNGQLLASSSDDGTVTTWDTKTWKRKGLSHKHTQPVRGLVWINEGRYLVSVGFDAKSILWDINGNKIFHSISFDNALTAVAYLAEKDLIAFGGFSKSIYLWDIKQERISKTLEGHQNTITSLSFLPKSNYLASKSMDGTVRIWDCEAKIMVDTLPERHPDNYVSVGIAFHPNLPILATLGDQDSTIRLWDFDSSSFSHLEQDVIEIKEHSNICTNSMGKNIISNVAGKNNKAKTDATSSNVKKEDEQRDVFVSYVQQDRQVDEIYIPELTKKGIKVYTERDFDIGIPKIKAFEKACEETSKNTFYGLSQMATE